MTYADLKTTATEKLDDGLHSVKRVIKQRTNDLENLRDAAALRIRRAPLQTVAIASGSGLILGLVMGYARGRTRVHRAHKM